MQFNGGYQTRAYWKPLSSSFFGNLKNIDTVITLEFTWPIFPDIWLTHYQHHILKEKWFCFWYLSRHWTRKVRKQFLVHAWNCHLTPHAHTNSDQGKFSSRFFDTYNGSVLNNYLFCFCESWQETAFLRFTRTSTGWLCIGFMCCIRSVNVCPCLFKYCTPYSYKISTEMARSQAN